MSVAFPEKTLFKLSGHRVLLWKDYGAVAPSLWTTNGHFGFVAQLTAEWVRRGRVISDSVLAENLDFGDAKALFAEIKAIYERWHADGFPDVG